MSDRTLTLTITVPEDVEEDLGGMMMSVEGHGIDGEITPILVLAAAEAMIRGDLRTALERENPMTTGDVLDAMAFLNGRLKVVDAVMHLPDTGPTVIASMEL